MKPTKAKKLKDLLKGEGEVGRILGPVTPALGSWSVPSAPVLPGTGQLGALRGVRSSCGSAALASAAAQRWLPLYD